MTDKIGSDGSPSGIGCTDPDGSCFSVYYSCTEPFRIVGDENAVQRNEYSCPDWRSVNEDWPLVWVGDNGEDVDVTTSGVYRRESSIWSEDDFTLTTVPNQYRQDAGGLCGEQVTATITSPTTTTSSETTATTASSLTSGTTTTTPTVKEGNNESNESKTPPPTSAGIVVASSLIIRIMILAGAITFGLKSLII
eukprot:scaffold13439_cov105-Skeletonema_dohrnii-CCMP3373.AAC.4